MTLNIRRAGLTLLGFSLALITSTSIALAQANNSSVAIADFQFTPATMQVAQGTTVTWTNNGPSNHTSTSDSGAWDSGVLQPGKSFSFKFNTPGTFAFHCTIHPNMKGTITVTAAGGSSAAASPAARQATAPTQMPKTGGGGLGAPLQLLWLLAVVPLGCAVALFRHSQAARR